MVLASGTRVALAYSFESTRGIFPSGIQTPLANVTMGTPSAGFNTITRGTGSFVTDGYAVGQRIKTFGWATAGNNGDFLVTAVTALTLTIQASTTAAEVSGAGKFMIIGLRYLRSTERNVNLERDVLESAEVRPTRQIADVRHGFSRVGGSVGYEFGVSSFDDLLELALGGTWITFGTAGVNLSSVAATDKFVRASGSFVTEGYRPGDIVVVGGFTATAMNINWRILAVTALEITVYDPTGIITDEAPGAAKTITLVGRRIDVGTNLRTISLERQFADVAQFQLYNGVAVNSMTLNITPESIVGGTVDLIGMRSVGMLPVSVSPTTPIAAPTNGPFAAFDGLMFIGGTLVAVATSMDLTINNNRQLTQVIGATASPDVFEGRCMIDGTLTTLFEDAALYNLFYNETDSSVWIRLDDPNNTDFISIVVPRLKAVNAPLNPPQEGPVPIEIAFRALEATVNGPGGVPVATSITFQRSNA